VSKFHLEKPAYTSSYKHTFCLDMKRETNLYSSKASIMEEYTSFLCGLQTTQIIQFKNEESHCSLHTLTAIRGHLKWRALHRSWRATWHSNNKASAQSNNSNVKARRGNWGVAGQSLALTIITATGSH